MKRKHNEVMSNHSLAMMRIGVSRSIARMHTTTQQKMKHYLSHSHIHSFLLSYLITFLLTY